MKKMLMATGLAVWSMRKGVGAPSFYKTLELYHNNGWKIDFWTKQKNLEIEELYNVRVKKLPTLIPLGKNRLINQLAVGINYIFDQFLIIFLYIFYKKGRKYNILYGYEINFIPGLQIISKITGIPLVSRFQGTILGTMIERNQGYKLRYFPHFFSISIKSSLTIMTDDGSLGDEVIKKIRKNNCGRVWFTRNGVDNYIIEPKHISPIINDILGKNQEKVLFLSISRLKKWKRVDRSLDVFKYVLNSISNCFYLIGGDGNERIEWEQYAYELGIASNVYFLGGLNKDEVYYLQQKAMFFLSTYELTNMGNPLFEAMRNRCVVATVSNGATGNLIKDGYNGIISSEKDYIGNGKKIISLIENKDKYEYILSNSINTIDTEFRTWNERMLEELNKVEDLIQKEF